MTNLHFTDFNEIKFTGKAFLLENPADDTQFWIKKGWVREDGSLTPAAIKASKCGETQKEKAVKKEAEKWTEATILQTSVGKNGRVLINVTFFKGLGEFDREIWVQKRSVKKGNLIPVSFLEAYAEEMSQGHARCSVQRVN